MIFSYLHILQLRAYSVSFTTSLHRLSCQKKEGTVKGEQKIRYSHLLNSVTSLYPCTLYSTTQETPNLPNRIISEFDFKLSSVVIQDTAKYLEQQQKSNSLFKHTGISGPNISIVANILGGHIYQRGAAGYSRVTSTAGKIHHGSKKHFEVDLKTFRRALPELTTTTTTSRSNSAFKR